MTPLDQLLLGLTLIGAGMWCFFAYMWTREIDRHERTKDRLETLRLLLKQRGVEPPREHPLAEHMLAANLGLREARNVRQIR